MGVGGKFGGLAQASLMTLEVRNTDGFFPVKEKGHPFLPGSGKALLPEIPWLQKFRGVAGVSHSLLNSLYCFHPSPATASALL